MDHYSAVNYIEKVGFPKINYYINDILAYQQTGILQNSYPLLPSEEKCFII